MLELLINLPMEQEWRKKQQKKEGRSDKQIETNKCKYLNKGV